MKTTGLSPENNQTLEIGIVLYDSTIHGELFEEVDFEELPKLNLRIIHSPESLNYNDFVYNMNRELIDSLLERSYNNTDEWTYIYPEAAQWHILQFLHSNQFITDEEFNDGKMEDSRLNVVGKNFSGFDRQFLNKIIDLRKIKMKHRVFDPSMLYFDISKDEELPDLKVCFDRSGLFDETYEVAHTAVQDAVDTLKVLLYKLIQTY